MLLTWKDLFLINVCSPCFKLKSIIWPKLLQGEETISELDLFSKSPAAKGMTSLLSCM